VTLRHQDEYERRAPYAPISAVREFFDRIRDKSVPQRVDRRFLQRISVATNNEWALLSALKFLGIVDQHGVPSHSYRLLQTTDQFQDGLRHLVETAYAQLFDVGGASMSVDELRDYFRVTSSPSQAKNAARFFREVCGLTGMESGARTDGDLTSWDASPPGTRRERSPGMQGHRDSDSEDTEPRESLSSRLLLETKARLLEKLPAPRPEWSAAQCADLCDRFLALLRNLDGET